MNNLKTDSIEVTLFVLFVFHFEISTNEDNDELRLKINCIVITLFEFHFEISGNEDNNEHD